VDLVREVQVAKGPEELMGLTVPGLGGLDFVLEDLLVNDLAAAYDLGPPLLPVGIDPDEAGLVGGLTEGRGRLVIPGNSGDAILNSRPR